MHSDMLATFLSPTSTTAAKHSERLWSLSLYAGGGPVASKKPSTRCKQTLVPQNIVVPIHISLRPPIRAQDSTRLQGSHGCSRGLAVSHVW